MTDTAPRAARQMNDNGPFAVRPKYVILEKHLVVEGKQAEVVAYYKDRVMPVLDEIERLWQEKYGSDIWDDLADQYFVHFRNHWDTVYRFTRFA